jgi:hypothetical protein
MIKAWWEVVSMSRLMRLLNILPLACTSSIYVRGLAGSIDGVREYLQGLDFDRSREEGGYTVAGRVCMR